LLHPGDTLYIKAGSYAEALDDVIPSGTSDSARVTVSNYQSDVVTIKPNSGYNVVHLGSTHNVSYITLKGLILDGYNISSEDVQFGLSNLAYTAQHVIVQDTEIKNGLTANNYGGVTLYPGCDYNQLIRLTIHDIGTTDFDHGIYMTSSNNTIQGCRTYNCAGKGIVVYESAGSNGGAWPAAT